MFVELNLYLARKYPTHPLNTSKKRTNFLYQSSQIKVKSSVTCLVIYDCNKFHTQVTSSKSVVVLALNFFREERKWTLFEILLSKVAGSLGYLEVFWLTWKLYIFAVFLFEIFRLKCHIAMQTSDILICPLFPQKSLRLKLFRRVNAKFMQIMVGLLSVVIRNSDQHYHVQV